jgi:hypothetical protein
MRVLVPSAGRGEVPDGRSPTVTVVATRGGRSVREGCCVVCGGLGKADGSSGRPRRRVPRGPPVREDLTAITSSGVGGGSHHYTSIMAEPRARAAFFDVCPPVITGAELAPFFDRVRTMLRPSPVPMPHTTRRGVPPCRGSRRLASGGVPGSRRRVGRRPACSSAGHQRGGSRAVHVELPGMGLRRRRRPIQHVARPDLRARRAASWGGAAAAMRGHRDRCRGRWLPRAVRRPPHRAAPYRAGTAARLGRWLSQHAAAAVRRPGPPPVAAKLAREPRCGLLGQRRPRHADLAEPAPR